MTSEENRRPGQWPVDNPVDATPESDEDQLYVNRAAERALREMVLDSIRHDLKQQPSPVCVLAAARRWTEAITAAGEEIATQMRDAA
ncbi:hypothetical protein [Streptomyces sp. NPDC127084]|uniref:hypothetical protein n=1 Tax=Streptomyces sp. NPDC127084 TaxID=3347133 RepID=UPI0036569AC7